jgi:hypothetical protein
VAVRVNNLGMVPPAQGEGAEARAHCQQAPRIAEAAGAFLSEEIALTRAQSDGFVELDGVVLA